MNRDAKIFVAGGTGMVGSAIIRKLLGQGYTNIISNYHKRPPASSCTSHNRSSVQFFRLDLSRQGDTEAFIEGYRPEYIFLAAAKVGGILANDTYKADFIYENIAIASNIIHSSHRYGVKKLLNLGSSCIYPKLAPQPMKEEYLLTGPLEPTNEPYAIAKISAIKLCRYYNEQYSTNFISVMPTNLYGPNDSFNLETSHVLPAMIRKFHLARLFEQGDLEGIKRDFKKHAIGFGLDGDIDFSDNEGILNVLSKLGIQRTDPNNINKPNDTNNPTMPVTVTLWGSGEVYREFLHVDDLADACVFLMENIDAWRLHQPNKQPNSHSDELSELKEPDRLDLPDYFVNLGTGEDLKIKGLATLIKDIVGFQGEILHDLTRPDGTPKKLLDVSKAKSLGWRPRINLYDGIKMTYTWYLKG